MFVKHFDKRRKHLTKQFVFTTKVVIYVTNGNACLSGHRANGSVSYAMCKKLLSCNV